MKSGKQNVGRALFLATMVWNLTAQADEATVANDSEAKKAEAVAHYEKGNALTKAGEWAKAEQEYNASLQAFPMPKTRGMLGTVQLQQDKFLEGVRNLEWFFQEETSVEVEKRERMRPPYIEAKKKVATIKLKVAPIDAAVSIDGVAILPNQVHWPHYVSGGGHVVEAKKDGFVAGRHQVTLGIGTEANVELTLVPEPVKEGSKTIEIKPSVKPAKMPPIVIAAWIGGGVLGALAIGTGIGAGRTYSSMDDAWHYRDCGNACETIYREGAPKLPALTATTLVTGVLSLGAFGFAIAKTLEPAPNRLGLRVVPTGNGLLFVGRW